MKPFYINAFYVQFKTNSCKKKTAVGYEVTEKNTHWSILQLNRKLFNCLQAWNYFYMWESVALYRVNDNIVDSGTTVLAIETHHGKWHWDISLHFLHLTSYTKMQINNLFNTVIVLCTLMINFSRCTSSYTCYLTNIIYWRILIWASWGAMIDWWWFCRCMIPAFISTQEGIFCECCAQSNHTFLILL